MSKISGKKIVLTILAFILSLMLFTVGALSSTLLGALNSSLLKNVLDSDYVYSGVREKAINSAQAYAIPSGISEDIFETIFSEETVKKDVKEYFEAAISGTAYEYDNASIKAQTAAAVKEDLKDDGIEDLTPYSDDIDEFSEKIAATYEDIIEINYFNYYYQIRSLIIPYTPYVFAGVVVFAAIIVLLLFKLYNFKLVHKVERGLSFSFGAAALMTAAPALFMQVWEIYKKVQLTPEYIYRAFVEFVSKSLYMFEIVAAIFLAISITLAFMSEIHRRKAKEKYQNYLRNSRSAYYDSFDDGDDFEQYESPKLIKDSFGSTTAQEYKHYKKYDGEIAPPYESKESNE